MTNLGIDVSAVDAAIKSARTAIDDAVGPKKADVPDPRFNKPADENASDARKANDRTRVVSRVTEKGVRDQGDLDRQGSSKLVSRSSGSALIRQASGGAPAGQSAVPEQLSAQQVAARAQFQQQLQQLMTPQAQQQGVNAFGQLAPAAQQAVGAGAGSLGQQYPPGSVALSRTQLAALLAAVDQAGSTEGGQPGAPGSGGVATSGEVSNKGALSVEEVQLKKTGMGTLSQAEVDKVIIQACVANGITDPQAQARWLDTMRPVVNHESTRNPDAGNGWDTNAVGQQMPDGLPAKSSRGLAQCIPSTFAAYHVAGTSTNIYDPTASVAASINYISHQYGGGEKDGTTLGEFRAKRSGGSYVGY